LQTASIRVGSLTAVLDLVLYGAALLNFWNYRGHFKFKG
jgi:hypothetical protein